MSNATLPDEIPLFPLNAVLFPGGSLPLRIFEARYMDMARECMKSGTPFGVCLIREGREVGQPAIPEELGCAARIAEWDMPQLGMLNVVARGGERFQVIERTVAANGLARANVEWLDPEDDHAVPAHYEGCVTLLKAIAADARFAHLTEDAHYESASWVGYRLSEALPIPLRIKQQLLALEGSVERLLILHDFLKQRGLLGK